MARRQRVAECIYVTASGKHQTWWRDQDDRVIWGTVDSFEAAIQLRDHKRRERAKILETPKLVRDMRRMSELLNPKSPTDQWTSTVLDYDENPETGPVQPSTAWRIR